MKFRTFNDLTFFEKEKLSVPLSAKVFNQLSTLKGGGIPLDESFSYAFYPEISYFGTRKANHEALQIVLADMFPFLIKKY